VFLSTDNGTSWTEMNDGLTNITINALPSAKQLFLRELMVVQFGNVLYQSLLV